MELNTTDHSDSPRLLLPLFCFAFVWFCLATNNQDLKSFCEHYILAPQFEKQALTVNKEDLEGTQKELDAALAYFDKLKPSCVDSGVSYALIPTEDFNKLTTLLSKNYGVTCKAGARQEESNTQVVSSDCTCKDYSALPALNMNIFANKEDKTGKTFSMPREVYMKDKGNNACKLMLNPSDMQVGAHYGET